MKVDVSQFKDPGLATVVYDFGMAIQKKKAKKDRQQPPARPARDPNERYRGHSDEQVAAAKRLADRIMGERED